MTKHKDALILHSAGCPCEDCLMIGRDGLLPMMFDDEQDEEEETKDEKDKPSRPIIRYVSNGFRA